MSKLRMAILFTAGIASAFACGNATTTLGGDKSAGDGNGGTSDAGPNEDGASASGGSGADASGGSGGSSWTPGDASFIDATMPLPCDLPELPPVENPTAEELERAQLVHDYCAATAREGCLDKSFGGWSFINEQTAGCTIEERTIACEGDILLTYAQMILPVCDDEWQASIRCATTAPCERPPSTCGAEDQALSDCVANNEVWSSVTGSRATCDYGPGVTECVVNCQVGSNLFHISCHGPEGLPLRCGCSVNGNGIGEFDFGIPTDSFYVSDCEDAATQAANGRCVNRLDCCVKYFDGTTDVCICGSDPARLQMSSCEAIAEYTHGTVVDICPQYEWENTEPTTCWPPPCYY